MTSIAGGPVSCGALCVPRPEVWELHRPDRALRPVAGETVVRYHGRHAPFHGPMVFAGVCACAYCRIPGQLGRRDWLTLADYAGGPAELVHVDPDHVRAVYQDDYKHLTGGA
jgi:hypothetical protein